VRLGAARKAEKGLSATSPCSEGEVQVRVLSSEKTPAVLQRYKKQEKGPSGKKDGLNQGKRIEEKEEIKELESGGCALA